MLEGSDANAKLIQQPIEEVKQPAAAAAVEAASSSKFSEHSSMSGSDSDTANSEQDDKIEPLEAPKKKQQTRRVSGSIADL